MVREIVVTNLRVDVSAFSPCSSRLAPFIPRFDDGMTIFSGKRAAVALTSR
jgi:hypothetical protein